MAKVFKCKICGWEGRGETEEEVLKKAAEHGQEKHGMTPSPEMAEQVHKDIRDE